MKPEQIIINSIKVEAKIRPKEKIFFGPISYTYEQFAEMLSTPRLSRKQKKLVKNHLNTLIRMFETSEKYREQCMRFTEV